MPISCLFSHNQPYYFPQRHLKVARKQNLCLAPLSLNGLVCHSVTEPCSLFVCPFFNHHAFFEACYLLRLSLWGSLFALKLLLRQLRSALHKHALIESHGIKRWRRGRSGENSKCSFAMPRPAAAQWQQSHGCDWSCSYSCFWLTLSLVYL